ncbi:hypothetical protein ACFX1R_015159 [Malus domestica]|uniref:UPF0481 protein At3g47200-like n=1 Tax=Malus domestica TaxID=3750 RepID=UPI00397511B7
MTGDIETGPSEPSPAATARGHRGEEIIPEGSNSEGHPENEKEEIPRTRDGNSVSIYKVPASLAEISRKATDPEMVFVGPWHCDKRSQSEFESTKHLYLAALLDRTKRNKKDYLEAMRAIDESTRSCYSKDHRCEFFSELKGDEFVEMMVLDGCFIIELFHRMNTEDPMEKNDPILSRPWLIPIVTRDLLKLENQIPFSVLQKLHFVSTNQLQEKAKGYSLVLLALNLFNNLLHRPIDVLKKSQPSEDPKHLLDLVYSSFCPQKQSTNPNDPSTNKTKKQKNPNDPSPKYRPSSESIQCTVQLRSSGINFKPQRADSFLNINFQGSICKVLQIPPIAINDFTTTLFINCMAWEQCYQNNPTWFTTYIAFMSNLITSPRDVTLLCSDGIITSGFLYNDHNVAELFKKLGEKAVFNIRECYLSKQFRDVEAYYSSHWATFIRTYFSKPWSFISVLYAIVLLFLTGGQTAMSILSYINDRSKNCTNACG